MGKQWGTGTCVFKELTTHHNLVKETPEATVNQHGLQGQGLLIHSLRGIKEADCGAHVRLAQGCALEQPIQCSECWLQQEVGIFLHKPRWTKDVLALKNGNQSKSQSHPDWLTGHLISTVIEAAFHSPRLFKSPRNLLLRAQETREGRVLHSAHWSHALFLVPTGL